MQFANPVFAVFLFLLVLSACNTSQSAKVSQHNNSDKSGINPDKVSLKQLLSTIPADGKLRDEHLTMYVSVKIKQEQLRYLQKSALTDVANSSENNFHRFTERDLEKIAIEDFGFNSEIYFWSKKMIHDTLAAYADSKPDSDADNLTKNNDALIHNLSIVAKHRDELRFAHNYRLKLQISSSRQSSFKNVSKNQLALTPKPSS